MDTDGNPTDKPKEKVKKQVKKGELPVISATASLDQDMKNILNEREQELVTQDKLVADTEDRKNALEEYIYETRGKIDDLYASFASEDEKSKIRRIMDEAEVRIPIPVIFSYFTNSDIISRNGCTMMATMLPRACTLPRLKSFAQMWALSRKGTSTVKRRSAKPSDKSVTNWMP